MNKKNAFTLIELVVTIAILGVLMIIAIPSVKYIQQANQTKKFEAYGKSLTASSKLYVDGYNEDLFGISNTGCAIIKYADLKNRDLIEDIQIKNTNCNTNSTCVLVKKNKNGNYHYETNIQCKENGKTIYNNVVSSCSTSICGLEDGSGPQYDVIFNPTRSTYYIGDNPKGSIKIWDTGVGLKEKQVLYYQWFRDGVASPQKTLNFNNKYYATTITRDIDMPDNLESINEPTKYFVRVTGTLYDVDNNKTEVNKDVPLNYFVGALLIQMKAGGATMATDHNANYKIDSSDYIYTGTNNRTISKIKYKGSADLFNYNNKDYINLTKAHYHIDKGKEWKRGSTEYNQDTKYKVSNFGYSDSDLIRENKTVEVTANWKINSYTLTYDNNGGSGCTSKTANYGSKWGPLCTPSKTGYSFIGWKSGSTTITENTDVTGNITATAQWKCNNVISGTLTKNKEVTYADIKWTVVDVDSSYVTLAANELMGNGSFNDAVDKVTKKLKNETTAMKEAINNQCATVLGSNSNNTSNIDSGPYWLTSGKVYFPVKVTNYTTNSTNYVHGYSGIVTEESISPIKKTVATSCETNTLISAKTTKNVNNTNETYTYDNGKCESEETSGKYYTRYTKYSLKKGGSSSTRLFVTEKKKDTTDSTWDFTTDISNVYKYRWQICGGSYSGDYYHIKAKDGDEFYAETYPESGNYDAKKYQKNGSNNKYLYFAGWKPGGSDNCKTLPSAHDYCSVKVKDDTSDNTGGYSGTDAHHYYDFFHYEGCKKRTKKVLSDKEVNIKYRPTIKVSR